MKSNFKINGGLNPIWEINISELKISSGCRYWQYNSIEELIKGIEELTKDIKDTDKKGEDEIK